MSDTGTDKHPFTAMPDPRDPIPCAISNSSAGFVRRKRRANPAAMAFSVFVTAALIGMLLLTPGPADRMQPDADTLVVIPLAERPADDSELPDMKPVDQAEVLADSPEEASPSSRPRTVAPAPALAVVPPPMINLAPVQVPEVTITGEGLRAIDGANSKGDLAQGPTGEGGEGGNGVAGDGSGGAGRARGTGSKLTASWAPGMDFSQNYRFYPREARRAGIEGVALLECFVLPRDRVRDCKLITERPSGHGFGKAALSTAGGLRVRIHNQAGRRIYNRWVIIESTFVLPKSEASGATVESEPQEGEALS